MNPNWKPTAEWHGNFNFSAKVILEMSEREYYWFSGGAEQTENIEQQEKLISDLRSAGFVVREVTDQNGEHCYFNVC